jgi:hypothetical protein
MSQSSKKTQERQYLKRFQQAFAGFPIGHILEWATPDFLIRSASSRIGIEVAEIVIRDAAQPNISDGPELVQNVFNQSNPAYPICRMNCDQAWLLLVTPEQRVTNWSDDIYSHRYQTAFDRAFLLENGYKLTELQVHQLPALE